VEAQKDPHLSRLLDDIVAGPDHFSKSKSASGMALGASSEPQAVDDLTGLLYRNRQRLLALRAAISELEGRRTTRPQTAGILPPIDVADTAAAPAAAPVAEEPSVPAPPAFFVTSEVPKITSVQVRLFGCCACVCFGALCCLRTFFL
jgi:hypothetical protein